MTGRLRLTKDLGQSRKGHEICNRVAVCLEYPSGGDCRRDSKSIRGDTDGSRYHENRGQDRAHTRLIAPPFCYHHARVHVAGADGNAARGNSHKIYVRT